MKQRRRKAVMISSLTRGMKMEQRNRSDWAHNLLEYGDSNLSKVITLLVIVMSQWTEMQMQEIFI